ncbi:MAG: MmcQ/YjbR family DNA-binding protein [Clostridia bacterium]|nr:MmcQ/YjbR family DNA-binding protein [Clostridia bacterium]
MTNKIFQYKSPNYAKLVKYGFAQVGDKYEYSTIILDGQFQMKVGVCSVDNKVTTTVTDLSTEEEYTLHLVAEASGAFVGLVRTEYEKVLTDIANNCYERDVFQSESAHKVIQYVQQKYDDDLQYLWKTFPGNAVWRRKDNNKWYGALLIISKRKLGLDSDEVIDVIDLRIDPEVLPTILDNQKYFAGYHMNKKKWFTMPLDGSVDVEEIYDWIDKSYELAKKG